MKKQEAGSALLWAVTLIMVLVITIAAAIQISYAYMTRSVEHNNERQAYLTAKGVIEDIVMRLEANDTTYLALFNGLAEKQETSLSIQVPSELGTITSNSSIKRLENEDTKGRITIQIEAQYVDETYALKADMQKGTINGVDTWQLVRYYQVETEITPSGNIVAGSDVLDEMDDLSKCWLTPGVDVNTCLTSNMTDEELANVKKHLPDYRPMRNNDTLRNYFYYRNDPPSFDVFNKAEITNAQLGDKLKDEDYYIQPYFSHDDYNTMIVYARTATPTINGYWSDINLFYNNNHWYYVGEITPSDFINGNTEFKTRSIRMTDFNNEATGLGNSSVEKWARFSAKYLIPENIIQ